jgi:hypothetical protein
MPQAFSFRRIFLGIVAGLLSTIVGLILAYLVGVVATFISTSELFTTLLVAFTYLPLMLLFVLLGPNIVIASMVGLTLGIANITKRTAGLIAGAITGLMVGEIVLSFLLPLIVAPQPGDFTSIVSNHYLSGAYGLILGVLTSLFFRMLTAG